MKKKWAVFLTFLLFGLSACTVRETSGPVQNGRTDSTFQTESEDPIPAPLLTAAPEDHVNTALVWKEQENAGGYALYRSEKEDGPYLNIALLPAGKSQEMMSYLDPFLETGKTYYYKVQICQVQDGYRTYGSMSKPVAVGLAEYNGYFHKEGALYYYQDNRLVADKTVNGLYFDPYGRYTTGDQELDSYLRQITAECTTEAMTQIEKFHAVYDWVIAHCSYIALPYQEGTDWEAEVALQMFQNRQGNCFYYAAAVAMLARNLGLEARAVIGSCYQTYTWVDHSWTEVVYEGETYLCDAEMEGVFAAEEGWSWDLFMKEYGTTPNEYSLE